MAIRVDVYTSGGMASGLLARACPLREALSAEDRLQVDRSVWQGLEDRAPRPAGTVNIAIDDILFAIADDEPDPPVHVAWHHVLLDSGPYTLEGDLATMPGFDPGRSLARPTGEFVLLRDVRLALRGHPEAGVSVGEHALVNRYAVEAIRADLMLGFFFPGAAMVISSPSAGVPIPEPVGGAV
jgi:hypothetical protein